MNRRILRIDDGTSLDDIIKKYKLDKRRKYFLYGGDVVTNTWITMECSGCTEYSEGYKVSGPAGCEECGYQGKRRNCYPAAVMFDNETQRAKEDPKPSLKILRIMKALRVSNAAYKKELAAQNEINVKLGKALDSSQEEVKRLKEENIWLDANCHTHAKNVVRILKMKEAMEEVVTNVRNRKGTDQEMKLSIHDWAISKYLRIFG